jgi:hypothetical protein
MKLAIVDATMIAIHVRISKAGISFFAFSQLYKSADGFGSRGTVTLFGGPLSKALSGSSCNRTTTGTPFPVGTGRRFLC